MGAGVAKRKRGRPKGAPGLMVFVSADTEAWLRREAKRTGVPATSIMELALLRLRHSRPDAGLVALREMDGGAHVPAEDVVVTDAVVPERPSDNPAVRAVLGR